jgi:alkanesulfonate monooxygenase SsuD/methylene tetrahydromethanopterin reductase-like flavin-dependent oxidoreductase (luciferase family)
VTNFAGNPTLGCVFRPQLRPEDLRSTAEAADAAGLQELWLWEDCFAEGGISSAAIALAGSSTLTVGVGVLPVPMRNVALTAMEIATLGRAFPGRVRIGVGHGVQDWMRQIGAHVASPMTLLREYFTCLHALLRGETVTHHGTYVSLSDVRLEWPPHPEIELLASATGPQDVVTSGTSPDELRAALVHIESGRARRSDAAAHSVVVYVMCATGPDARVVADGACRWYDAGATTVVLQPPADVDIHKFVRFVGSDVQPLLVATTETSR